MNLFKYIFFLSRKSAPAQGARFPLLTGFAVGIILFSVPAQAMIPRSAILSLFKAPQEDLKLKKKDDKVDINLKKKEPKKDDFDEFEEGEEKSLGFQFIFSGFVELENFISTYIHQDPEDIDKKNEFRVKLTMQLGNENYYFKCVPNFYFLPFFVTKDYYYDDYHYASTDFEFGRNGRMSGRYYEISFNECYVNVGFEHFRLRLGNQIYAWGTSDLFNPTSYINPGDGRELPLKEGDEAKLGVPSLSSMVFLSDFSLEFVFVPIPISALSPLYGNFWSYVYTIGRYTPYEVKVVKKNELPPAGQNLGYGVRFAGSVSGVDFSFSVYQGPDNAPLLRPLNSSTEIIRVAEEYRTSTNLGADISFKLWKFEIHGEIAYSPNKFGVVDNIPKNLSDTGELTLHDDCHLKRAHYLSYTFGFNFIWKDLICAAEWLQSMYFDSRLMESFYNYMLMMSVSYSFLDELIKLSMTAVVDVKDVGYILMPRIDFDFECGVSLWLAYCHIGSKPSSDNAIEIDVFSLYDKNDIVVLGVRYGF